MTAVLPPGTEPQSGRSTPPRTALITRPAGRLQRLRLGADAQLWIGGALILLVLVTALVSLVWTPYDPSAMSGGRLEAPSLAHWAGTDRLGRDSGQLVPVGGALRRIERSTRVVQQDVDVIDGIPQLVRDPSHVVERGEVGHERATTDLRGRGGGLLR